MKFRPCIDIHNGKVKQIVGGSLKDQGDQAAENFVSEQDAAFYAELYKKAGLKGGHVILLNGKDSPNYEATKAQALQALGKYPGGLQIGGGICPENAAEYLEAGASHVIVTSYVFKNGVISWENLEKIRDAAGKEHLVLDLSCRKKRWQILYCHRPMAEIYRRDRDTGADGKAWKLLRRISGPCSGCGRKGPRCGNRACKASGTVYSPSGDLCRRCGFYGRY